jgi:hypothetical protein
LRGHHTPGRGAGRWGGGGGERARHAFTDASDGKPRRGQRAETPVHIYPAEAEDTPSQLTAQAPARRGSGERMKAAFDPARYQATTSADRLLINQLAPISSRGAITTTLGFLTVFQLSHGRCPFPCSVTMLPQLLSRVSPDQLQRRRKYLRQ